MDRFGYQQNALGACEWEGMGPVVCPKPRRFGFARFPINFVGSSHCPEIGDGDAAAANDLLEIILPEGGYNPERPSPPYFLGSPPCRAANPLVHDVRFMDEGQIRSSSPAPPSPSARNGGGCARTKFGHKPAPVRIEGFNCSISTMA